MSNCQIAYKAHRLTANAFMYGSIISDDKEAELRRLGFITDTRVERIECAKLSRVGKEIASKLDIDEIDEIMAS
jgi:hypothetical protein